MRLYRLAIEKAQIGAKYHAVAEEGIAMREIAEAISQGLHIPAISVTEDEASAHFGWLIKFAGRELAASGKLTQERLKWSPEGPGLIPDLQQMNY